MHGFIRTAFIAALACGTLAAAPIAAVPAAAAEARASGDVPVRAGPGNRYRIIDRLHDGEYYEVLRCTRQSLWCLVGEGRYELGWVRGSYLVGSGAKARATPFEFLVNPRLLGDN
jgi:uncharacterized protein YraI